MYLPRQNMVCELSNRLEWRPRRVDEYRVPEMKLNRWVPGGGR